MNSSKNISGPSGGAEPRKRSRPGLEVKIWSDFVCPYCFLAEGQLKDATSGLAVRVDWMPFELRPYPERTLRPEGNYLQTVWQRSVYPLAAQLGVDIRLPDVSPQPYSRLAHEGLLFAKEHGKAAEYVDAVFRAFFQCSLDIGDPGVLQSIAQRIGLQGEAFAAALRDGSYAAEHLASLALARQFGIRAVPTIMIGDDRLVGMSSAQRLRQLFIQKAGPGTK
ncbi:DsbA family oxidoreductase [Bradyrhizobium sp. 169]|uniref:DsbA family oxidoreductase n=1 Tax=Bradyrhizobium sp. 169 TaxID=2782640 RepID=UPI001FFA19AD|nr:DsbA family oxidoreductase [Bradyrhizobium sp. 169]MCK1591087.1 DsbA family oxidoreductase [Bradyrhizobium sp. 169]